MSAPDDDERSSELLTFVARHRILEAALGRRWLGSFLEDDLRQVALLAAWINIGEPPAHVVHRARFAIAEFCRHWFGRARVRRGERVPLHSIDLAREHAGFRQVDAGDSIRHRRSLDLTHRAQVNHCQRQRDRRREA